ncbi:MAG: hypothetical protein B6244_09350 [Candidatus Cloacimonetes bacterium 4572_55]|nr:MAG: hypothetical protein B6244_09350 [Candidatus Cloacimonetes bacterium 4572_55]
MTGNIILIGFMGVGKDTIGKIIAHRTTLRFVSTDHEILKKEGEPIHQIIEKKGESYSRQLESDLIQILKKRRNMTLAAGCGCVFSPQNRNILQEMGSVVHLTVEPALLETRFFVVTLLCVVNYFLRNGAGHSP